MNSFRERFFAEYWLIRYVIMDKFSGRDNTKISKIALV